MRFFAQFVSVIFHPLLMLTYMLVLLLLVNPYLFGVNNIGDQLSRVLILRIFLATFFIPALSVVMLRFLGMVESIELKDKQERIGPYIITGIFYMWMFRNFLDNSLIPTAYTSFMLGATIALFVAFFINIFSKISAHAVGMGGLLGMVVLTMLEFSHHFFTIDLVLIGPVQFSLTVVLLLVILASGLVGTSRLLLQAHHPQDLYGGFVVGFFAQFIAYRFLFL